MKKIFTLCLLLVAAVQGWAFEQDKYYTINRNGETGSYIYAADGVMQTGALNADNGVYVWQFVPTGKADCYYIKNVATDTYMQTCNITLSTNVQLGNDPVEYYVSRGAGTTGSGTTYFLASNDQGTINYNDDATLGLNKGATGVVAFYVKTGRGNSYWEIKETSYNTTAPEPPADEDPDVCSTIIANGGFIVDAILCVGEATGVDTVETAAEVLVYTLDGRRVNKAQGLSKGVYIVGNKKVYVK